MSIVLIRKIKVDEFSYGSQRICASLLLELMPMSAIPTPCVKQCLLVCIQNRTMKARPSTSHYANLRFFENMVWPNFQRLRPDCRIESNVSTSLQNKISCFSADRVCNHCNTVSEALGRYCNYCFCQEARLSLTDANIERGVKKREHDEMRRHYVRQKGYQIVEMWECEWWSLFSQKTSQRQISLQTSFEWKTTLAKTYRWETPRTNSMLFWSSRSSATIFPKLSFDIEKYRNH